MKDARTRMGRVTHAGAGRRFRAPAVVAAALITVAACAAEPTTAAPEATRAAESTTAAPEATGAADATTVAPEAAQPSAPDGNPVEHVVLVSVDGLNPEAIRSLGPAGAPAFHRLITEGASTLNARTVDEATVTLPNHTSMITGRPVTGAAGHGVTFNADNGGTVHEAAGSYCAGIFDVVHDAGGTTALYAGKQKFDFLDRSWDDQRGASDTTGADDGRDKIDTYLRADGGEVTDALREALTSDPADFAMIHYAGPDQTGHAQGWLSSAYLAEVRATDALIGELLDTVADDEALAASTVVVVTSDHGGTGTSHAEAEHPADYTVPFFTWGVGVAAGADLYALNPDRRDPGSSRPGYDETPAPIRNAEAGNLAADLLGLAPIPGSRINADQTLDLD